MVGRDSWTRCGVIITQFVIAGTDRSIVAVLKGIVRIARCHDRVWNGSRISVDEYQVRMNSNYDV